jgi:hypothetical protein
MHYSIIYSVDIPSGVNMRPFVLPKCKLLWQETEDDSQYEYGYLEGRWTKGHHRKWCAILDEEQFAEFVNDTGLFAEDVQTMGSLGAPGHGYGVVPAISFRSEDDDAIQSAYVTPSGTAAEIAEFLQRYDKPVPQCLLDSTEQVYLSEEHEKLVQENEPSEVWDSLREIVIDCFS